MVKRLGGGCEDWRGEMNTFETSIHRQLVKEKEGILRQFSFCHDQAKEDALAALKKLEFCIDHMDSVHLPAPKEINNGQLQTTVRP